MSSKTDPFDLPIKVVGKWKETYGWIPIFAAFAAIFMAFLTGANNLPAPFSTPIGSGGLTLLKAFVIACLIYVPGAAFASSTSTVNALFSYFLEENQPSEGFLMWSLVVVLITAAIWLALATYLQLPVSSAQSIQGALLGTILVTQGFDYIPLWNKNQNHNFIGGGLVSIVLEWTVAPLIAFLCAFLLFAVMKVSLLRHENSEKRILVFLPIDYGISAGLLCLYLMYQIMLVAQAILLSVLKFTPFTQSYHMKSSSSDIWKTEHKTLALIPHIFATKQKNGNCNQVLPHMITVYSWVMIVGVAVATLIGALLSLLVVVPLAVKKLKAVKNYRTMKRNMTKFSDHSKCIESQDPTCNDTKSADDEAQFEEALKDFMQMRVLDTVYEEDERSWASPDPMVQEPDNKLAEDQSPASQDQSNTEKSTSFRKLLESTPNQLVQSHTRNFQKIEKSTPVGNAFQFLKGCSKSIFSPEMEYDRHTLVRHALAEKYEDVEDFFSSPHLIASCIFALIQSASEVAAVLSPYGAILDVFQHREKYSGNRGHVGNISVTWWFKAIGGFGAALGFLVCGFRVTKSLGGRLTYMSNSRGLAAQLSTVAAIIIVTKIKLPVSTIHAFVGSLVGVGIADDPRNVNWKLLLKFICGWVVTIVFCSGVAYVIFSMSIHSPAYVVR